MFTEDEKIIIQFYMVQALKNLSYDIITGKVPSDDEDIIKEKDGLHSILKKLSK
jgi:hypothetical protein